MCICSFKGGSYGILPHQYDIISWIFLKYLQEIKKKTKNILPRNSIYVLELEAENLTNLCKRFNIPLQLPKKANWIFLCDTLGISTTGKQTASSTPVHSESSNRQTEESEHSIRPQKLCQRTYFTKNRLCVRFRRNRRSICWTPIRFHLRLWCSWKIQGLKTVICWCLPIRRITLFNQSIVPTKIVCSFCYILWVS